MFKRARTDSSSAPVEAEEAVGEFAEFEGTTSFSPASAATHRYKLSLRSSKLRIWLEDCENKSQWCTSELALESYINLNNAFPSATAADYVEYFHVILNKTVEDADETPRAFQRTKGDVFRLEIAMKVQALTQTRVVTYAFDLEPISVERIDVLESRMRDLQEEMKALRVEAGAKTEVLELQETVKKLQEELTCRQVEISKLQRKVDSALLTIEVPAKGKTSGDVVRWVSTENYSNGKDGMIRNLEPGVYRVTAVVNYAASDHEQTLELKCGDNTWQVVYCTFLHQSGQGAKRTVHSDVTSRTRRVMSRGVGENVASTREMDCRGQPWVWCGGLQRTRPRLGVDERAGCEAWRRAAAKEQVASGRLLPTILF